MASQQQPSSAPSTPVKSPGGGGADASQANRRATQFICVTAAGDLPLASVGWRPRRAGAAAGVVEPPALGEVPATLTVRRLTDDPRDSLDTLAGSAAAAAAPAPPTSPAPPIPSTPAPSLSAAVVPAQPATALEGATAKPAAGGGPAAAAEGADAGAGATPLSPTASSAPSELVRALRQEVAAQRRRAEATQRERDMLREQVTVLQEQVAQLSSSRVLLRQSLAQLSAQLAQAETDREQLQEEVQAAVRKALARFMRSEAERRATEQQRCSARMAIDAQEGTIEGLSERAAAIAARLQALEDEAGAVEDEPVGASPAAKAIGGERKLAAASAEWRARYEEARRSGRDPFSDQPQLSNSPDSDVNIQWIDVPVGGAARVPIPGQGQGQGQGPQGALVTVAQAATQQGSAAGQAGATSVKMAREIFCATPNKLIEQLTMDKPIDPDNLYAFLLTFRTFMSPMELLKRLVIRYRTAPPTTEGRGGSLIQLRVCKVIQAWVDKYPRDFDDQDLRTSLNYFAYAIVCNMRVSLGIICLLSRDQSTVPAVVMDPPPPPLELMASSEGDPFVLRLAPLEFARQLAMMNSELFMRINSKELLNPKGWTQPIKDATMAPNIVATIRSFNRLSQLLTGEILSGPDRKRRSEVLRHLIQTAHESLVMGDFSAVVAIGAALSSGPILRLHKTFDYLQKKVLLKKEKHYVQEIQALLDNSYGWKKLRMAHETATLPAVPHLGLFLMDLTFLEEGNPDTINGLVNFAKRKRVAAVVQRVLHFQQKRYSFAVLPQVREWLEQSPVSSDDQLFDISEHLEPREPANT